MNDSTVWYIPKDAPNPVTIPFLENVTEDKSITAAFFTKLYIGTTDFVTTEVASGVYDVRMDKPFEFIFTVQEGHRDFVLVDVDGTLYKAEPLGNGKYRYTVALKKDTIRIKPSLTPIFSLVFDVPSGISVIFCGQALTSPAVPLEFAVYDIPAFVLDAHGTEMKVYANDQPVKLERIGATEYSFSLPPITGNVTVKVRLAIPESPGLSVTPTAIRPAETRLTVSAQGLKIETPDVRTIAVYALTGQLKAKQTVRGTAFVPLTKGVYIVKAGDRVSRIMVR
jgi:hypothetical protein